MSTIYERGINRIVIPMKGGKMNKLDKFILISNNVHNHKYNYDYVIYDGVHKKVEIICPNHGSFFQEPISHRRGSGCPLCCKENKFDSKENFIAKSIKVHNHFYDYSKVEYTDSHTKVKIICPKHGVFEQTPNSHLQGTECRKCSYEKRGKNLRLSTEEFIKKSKEKHGDLYDYSLVYYVTNQSNVKIICPKHGVFEQQAASHMNIGTGCPKCNMIGSYTDIFFEIHPEQKEVAGIFYFIKMSDGKEEFYKIGITKMSVFDRFRGNTHRGYTITTLYTLSICLYQAFLLEQKIKLRLGNVVYIPKRSFSGYKTECFILNDQSISDTINVIQDFQKCL